MNDKAAKRLRKAIRVANLPASGYLIHKRTGVIRLGPGARQAYQRAKRHLTADQRKALCAGVLSPGAA